MKIRMISIFIGAAEELYADKILWINDKPVCENQWLLTQEEVQAIERLVEQQVQLGYIE